MHTQTHPQLVGQPGIGEAETILRACVHCGFCTAHCPTYQETGDELDGPRGRIYLIRDLLETGSAGAGTVRHLDRCLTCRACETVCPSGVRYGELLDVGRGLLESRQRRPLPLRLLRRLLEEVVSRPRVFAALLVLGRLVRPLYRLPGLRWLRHVVPPRQHLRQQPERQPGRGTAAAATPRILLLDGCVQGAATPRTNAALAAIAAHLGMSAERVRPPRCCGSLRHHLGAAERAADDVLAWLEALDAAWQERPGPIVSAASGCTVTLREHPALLRMALAHTDAPQRRRRLQQGIEQAERLGAALQDSTEWLGEVLPLLLQKGRLQKGPQPAPLDIALQEPCSVQHGLRLGGRLAPLLAQLGLHCLGVPEAHLCCGSAGSYSLLQPTLAGRLRRRKLAALQVGRPSLIATLNVGCQMHLAAAAEVPVVHVADLVAVRLGLLQPEPAVQAALQRS